MVISQRPLSSSTLLTDHVQLVLAHYCEGHGPTPIMVTEGLPEPCSLCYDDRNERHRPQTSATETQPQTMSDSLRKMTLSASRSSSLPASEQEAQAQRAALRKSSKLATMTPTTPASPIMASALETPPQSPSQPCDANNEKSNGSERDSSFRRTYDDSVTKRAKPCENCAFTVPKEVHLPEPKLRTRTPYARVFGSPSNSNSSPPNSNPQSSCASDAEEDISPGNSAARPTSHRRLTTSTSHSSVSSKSSLTATHTHYMAYTSAHDPEAANTYSIVRASCLRTLSFETLPSFRHRERGYSSSSNSSTLGSPVSSIPPSMRTNPGYISSPAAPQSAASGGPIFFGDPLSGYTTAYIFRIPDMHARGRKRVYAFMALSTHHERRAMKVFNFLANAFQGLAEWIQGLAEAVAQKEANAAPGGAGLDNGYSSGLRGSGIGLGGGSSAERDTDRGTRSSFISAGGRSGYMQRYGTDGSTGPGGFSPKARGLPELVGLPDFFIQLHRRKRRAWIVAMEDIPRMIDTQAS